MNEKNQNEKRQNNGANTKEPPKRVANSSSNKKKPNNGATKTDSTTKSVSPNSQSRQYRDDNGKGEKPTDNARGGNRGANGSKAAGGNPCSPKNDVSWYSPSPQQVKDAASLTWAEISGLQPPSAHYEVNPGIMIYRYRAIPGVNSSANDPINVAAQKLFTWIRHSNSGNYNNYDQAFVMMYLYAMDQIFTLWSEATRAYGLINAYSSRNRYYPRYLLSCLGWNFTDLQEHIVDFRAYMNQIAIKLSTLAVPAVLPMFSRHLWMTTGVYADSDKTTAQLFAFVPTGYFRYSLSLAEEDPEAPNELDGLIFEQRPSSFNFETFRTVMDKLVDAVWMNTTFGILSGDIVKAFGGSVIFLPELHDEYALFPGFNAEVMTQIQNMRTVPQNYVLTDKSSFIYQERQGRNNYLMYRPRISQTSLVSTDAAARANSKNIVASIMGPSSFKVFTTPLSDPTPEDNMVASRLIFTLGDPIALDGDYWAFDIATCGTEIVETATMYGLVYHEDGNIKTVAISPWDAESIIDVGSDASRLHSLSFLSKFDWHHEVWVSEKYVADHVVSLVDVDNYTYLPAHTIMKMNDCAIQGEYGLGLMTAWNLSK